MGNGSSGFGMDVEGLHQVGRTVSARSEEGAAAANRLKRGLDTASGKVGHHSVKGALARFVTEHVLDPANKLPVQLDNAGTNVSNVASVARDGDTQGAAELAGPVADSTSIGARINRQV